MRSKARHHSSFRLVYTPVASWVALLLAFFLTTHAFWCGLGGGCEDEATERVAAVASRMLSHTTGQTITPGSVHHTHTTFDVCAGIDETRSALGAPTPTVTPPLLIWVALVFVATTVVLLTLSQRAEVFGRDGPVCVPRLHSRFVRASLPHRAPPFS